MIVSQKKGQLNFRFFSAKTGAFLTDMSLGTIDDIFVSLSKDDNFFMYSGGNWHDIWLGIRPADGNVTQQLMDLSGYTLDGSRFKKNRTLEYAEAVMDPDAVGSWSEYLEWTFLPFQGVGGNIK